jgi:hypothetical protein
MSSFKYLKSFEQKINLKTVQTTKSDDKIKKNHIFGDKSILNVAL